MKNNRCNCNKLGLAPENHAKTCVIRLTMYGAPDYFGVGKHFDVRSDGEDYYQFDENIGSWLLISGTTLPPEYWQGKDITCELYDEYWKHRY